MDPVLYDLEQPDHCPVCDSTETGEIHDERQSILVCANCGSDEPALAPGELVELWGK